MKRNAVWGASCSTVVSAGAPRTEAPVLDVVIPGLSPTQWTFATCPPPPLSPFYVLSTSNKGHCDHKILKKAVWEAEIARSNTT